MAHFPRDPCAAVVDDASHLRKGVLMNLKGFNVHKVLIRDLGLWHSYPEYPAQPDLVEWDVIGSSALRAT